MRTPMQNQLHCKRPKEMFLSINEIVTQFTRLGKENCEQKLCNERHICVAVP